MASPYAFRGGSGPRVGQLVYKTDPRRAGRVTAIVSPGGWGQVEVRWTSGRVSLENVASLQDFEARMADYEKSLHDYHETASRLSGM